MAVLALSMHVWSSWDSSPVLYQAVPVPYPSWCDGLVDGHEWSLNGTYHTIGMLVPSLRVKLGIGVCMLAIVDDAAS